MVIGLFYKVSGVWLRYIGVDFVVVVALQDEVVLCNKVGQFLIGVG